MGSTPNDNQPTTSCHVVAVPYPGRGHINPMLNVCSVIAENNKDILITFVITEEWLGLIGSVSKPPNVRFATIANVLPSELIRGDDPRGFWTTVKTKMEEPVERLVDQLRLPAPAVIVADAFLAWAADLAARRNIPLASVWPMSASVFTVLYHFDLLNPKNGDDIVDCIPGLSPLRVADLPTALRDKEAALSIPQLLHNRKFLIFTSIYDLESQVIDALKQKSTFSIYNIGPSTSYFKVKNIDNQINIGHRKDLLHPPELESEDLSENNTSLQDNFNYYLKWLDLQPPDSVLYISLGSFLSVSKAQIDEIATGLVKSGVRFLWVTRAETLRLQEICGVKGLIVAWCDQLRVLSHPSVGGFWSHCGWNSTNEALLTGMPVLTFPILMDQVPNAKAIVEDWKIGWRVKRMFDENDLARGNEIAEIVERFMNLESEERKEITTNAKELQKICEKEFADGGSFQTNVDGLTTSILQLSPTGL
ncbi:hypothetical protein BUALT_Bualt02G0006300 [Buddleja alternifolia]|uniref:Uncharacterized protein n=1 Tax=Buddleja alternifolia TaxID=168488 RepID=A0AAV6Y720_9LAMI|nr:hypothetical protein BUALT_Bualt02G0006300 [Buddleja alternifolia]